MLIKEVLGLFFKYPLKGFPVVDDRDERILGVMTKDSLIGLGSGGANLDLGLSDTSARVTQPMDAEKARLIFGGLDPAVVIPTVNRRGEIRKVVSKADLLASFEKKPDSPVPAAGPVVETVLSEPSAAAADAYAVMDSLKVPVLLASPNLVVRFANHQFLETFNFEKDFILNQKVARFFKGVRLDDSLGGAFSYLHKRWQYRISFAEELVAVVFIEVKERSAPNPVLKEVEKILKGKLTLKGASEAWENGIIRKVCQRVRETSAAARKLGLSEEALKIRLQKMR